MHRWSVFPLLFTHVIERIEVGPAVPHLDSAQQFRHQLIRSELVENAGPVR